MGADDRGKIGRGRAEPDRNAVVLDTVVLKVMRRERTVNQIAWARCGWLTAVTALLWLALLAPAWFVAGRDGLVGLCFAAVLCLVPGWVVFWMAARFGAAGGQVPLVILGGMVLRMMFVLLGMVIVQSFDERLGRREFVIWLAVFYVCMLAVETLMVLPRSDHRTGQPGAGAI
jgi:hypothetical protein